MQQFGSRHEADLRRTKRKKAHTAHGTTPLGVFLTDASGMPLTVNLLNQLESVPGLHSRMGSRVCFR